MRLQKRYLRSAVVGLVLATAAGASAAQEKELVRVGGTPNYGPVLPVHAANELGLFEKLGIKVEFTGYQGGAAAMEAIAAGEADIINYFPPGLALAKQRGVEAKIVGAGTLTPRGWKIMVAEDSTYEGLSDLAGEPIGITANGSTTDFFALWAGEKAGGAMTRVPVGGGGLTTNLLSGNVAAIVAYPPLSYDLENSGNAKVLVDLGKEMEPNLPDVWVASGEMIEQYPEITEKFLQGIYSAVSYMHANPEWSIDFLADQNGLEPEVAKQEYENTILGLSADGEIKEEWVEASLELGRLAGMDNLPPVSEMYTSEFVPVDIIEP